MFIIDKIKNWYRRLTFYVLADCTDNSITFSKALFRHMDVFSHDVARVMVFRVGDDYAFTLNPELDQPTQLAEIQYNELYKCIGFECLVPTVNRIFYDYGLPPMAKAKLTVLPERAGDTEYYRILRPSAKLRNRHVGPAKSDVVALKLKSKV